MRKVIFLLVLVIAGLVTSGIGMSYFKTIAEANLAAQSIGK